MQIELENVSPIENDPAIADGTEEVIPQAVEGGARPKSYLDSVVGQGTDAAPFLVDNFNGSADSGSDAERKQQSSNRQHRWRRKGSKGPTLMFNVTRADQRPAGRPPGQNVSTGPNKGNQNATGSRFAPLDGNDNNESVQGNGNNAAPEMEQDPTEGASSPSV
nr:hypothetical protein Iba_chr06fCG9580 [Ipomoea batatas]